VPRAYVGIEGGGLRRRWHGAGKGGEGRAARSTLRLGTRATRSIVPRSPDRREPAPPDDSDSLDREVKREATCTYSWFMFRTFECLGCRAGLMTNDSQLR